MLSALYIHPVYKVPPLKKNEGYRANDWGNLAEPLWKGRLRFIERTTTATLQLEDAQTGRAFSPYLLISFLHAHSFF